MKVLVIGNGGREHALCWQLRRQTPAVELYCAPGSFGIAHVADCVPIPVDEIQRLADLAAELGVDLTIVGPELPLSLGIVDQFQERGLAIFGPRQAAARLESSKAFAKAFMGRHQIPTAAFEVVHDAGEGKEAAGAFGFPVVLKADGLAAGKGVLIAHDQEELIQALATFFDDRQFGSSGDLVVVEEFVTGEEVSIIGLSDGHQLLAFASSKDYKRIGENDSGPNTGGMGAHSPSGVIGATEARDVLDGVMNRTIRGMASEGSPLVGFLYAGLVLTGDGPKVLEFNVRLGDPEAQVLLLRLESDLAELLYAGAAGDFGGRRLQFRKEAAACVVLAAESYPGSVTKGAVIEGLEAAARHEGVVVFHAGSAEKNGRTVVSGGRVLNVCATGSDLRDALKRAYGAASEIHWPGRQMRRDIGRRVLEAPSIQESGIFFLPRGLQEESGN